MTIKIGSRESRLALVQSEIAAALLRRAHPGICVEIVPLKTSGDILKDKPLEGGKGLFTRELDNALLEGRTAMSVHSLKDVPGRLPEGLAITAFCAAGDERDALVLPQGAAEFDTSKPAGCSSKRRAVQLAALYPGVRCAPVRGNVPTRLEKLDAGEYGALVLAKAGLDRLGLESRASRVFSRGEMLPAAGQGILAVITRTEGEAAALARAIDEPVLRRRATAERSFLRTLGADCGFPTGAYAEESDGKLTLEGGFALKHGGAFLRAKICGAPDEAEVLGQKLARRLLVMVAKEEGILGSGTLGSGTLGSVTLVGAGPGDPGLLTLRGADALDAAEVVVFDKLVGPGVLARIPRDAEKIAAGKEPGNHLLPQDEINTLIIRKAAEGKRVVRLKGGDVFLFGRGGEEALACADAGVPCTVVPGVSAALAVPASAGIPVTQRGIASSVHIITAHNKAAHTLDYAALARLNAKGGTLVFMMSASCRDDICARLIEAGVPSATPAALISGGTTAKERSLVLTLQDYHSKHCHSELADPSGDRLPAVFVVGSVCGLAATLAAVKKPLKGVRIALTRPRGGKNRLAALLDAVGAEVVEIPAIRIVPRADPARLHEALNAPNTGTWFAFTSVHGVDAFFLKLAEYSIDVRSFAACKFAALGNAVRAALAARGVIADLVPEQFSGASLGAALAKTAQKDSTVILPRSSIGGREILEELAAAGLRYTDIPLYDTLTETGFENPLFRAQLTAGLDCAAFTSPSGAAGWVEIFGGTGGCSLALCIGKTTAAAARLYGFTTMTPLEETLEGMTAALIRHYADRRRNEADTI